MTETKFTPGPWAARQEFANRWRIEVPREGFVPISVGLACTTILEVGCTDADTAANAHLIATAPEMYEALDAAYRFITQPVRLETPKDGPKTATYRTERYNELTGRLRAALAKARGEQ